MRLQTLCVLIAAALPALGLGQTKVVLKFQSESPRIVFSSKDWPIGLPANTEMKTGKEVEFPLGTILPVDSLVVWDRDSNNVAIRTVKDVGAEWNVMPEDLRFVGLVKVRVEHKGEPVAAAQVEIQDKARKMSQVLDPSSKGDLQFFGIVPGEFKINVSYRSGGRPASTRQGFEVSLKRPSAVPTYVVSLTDSVDVAGASSSDAKPEASGAKPDTDARRSPSYRTTSNWFVFLAILLVLVAAVWLGLHHLKKNQALVADHLKNLGVPMPDPSPTPPGAAPGASLGDPVQHQPVQKIMLPDAAPTPLVAAPAAPKQSSQPRLVMESGTAIELQDGENAVGRDAGLAVSLEGESTVSRRHAVVILGPDGVQIKDLGSTNGTYVNGQKLDGERPLLPGDSVQFGQVRFRYEA